VLQLERIMVSPSIPERRPYWIANSNGTVIEHESNEISSIGGLVVMGHCHLDCLKTSFQIIYDLVVNCLGSWKCMETNINISLRLF
jgi:hypothetical protein